ncbi:glutamate-1-semialdehyde 2,1-aminomutase [Bryobacterales bacterium F-183]|nr:glutamate-1-semialdehyde 2,1-aminomutase [Bryobacterales bacterium F-183]
MNTSNSENLFARAQHVTPGGVNSPVRAFRGVGGTPRFMQRGQGPRMWDADGNSYLDYIGSWGPHILGHRPEPVIEALREVLELGTSFGAPTGREVELATEIIGAVPSIEMVRLVNSGTEATMSALRVARGYTKRDLTIKFEGCYHGHVDSLLVKAGSGMATLGIADTQGVPKAFADTTIALPYNDVPALEAAFANYGDKIAAVIVEPVVGNMGCVIPTQDFLQAMRQLTEKHGALLIFDEVMTGFRLALGGAQQVFNIKPDLTTLGKIIGGGLPLAAYGGREDIMKKVAPAGPVYQAGTLSGNPVAVSAGLAMVRYLKSHPEVYDRIDKSTAALAAAVPSSITVNRFGSMITFFFKPTPVTDWESAKTADTKSFGDFFHYLLERGVYFPPSQFEAAFISAAHTDEDIATTVNVIRSYFES